MRYLICLMLSFFALNAFAHENHTKHQTTSGLAISLAFDAQGTLWRASTKEGFVLVDKSTDLGKTFSAPVKVNATAQKIGADGEARPKIALSPQGYIYLTWTEALKKPFAGYIWFARSVDNGKSFEKPYTVHQDKAEITHRFDALQVAPNGELTVLWVDKRDLEAAKKAGKKYDGAAIYYAVSTDAGKSFKHEQKLADASCECCRIATTLKPDGTVTAMWRHVFAGSERDHMIAEVPSLPAVRQAHHERQEHDKNSPVRTEHVEVQDIAPIAHRATFGHWQIDGCPHHGAALATGGEGNNWWGYHMAYFDGNEQKPGLYYSRMDGVAWASSPAKAFGDNAKQAGHPTILSAGEKVYLVWREQFEGASQIVAMISDDEGKSWNAPQTLTTSSQKADYPILLQYQAKVYLAWNVANDGLKLIEISVK